MAQKTKSHRQPEEERVAVSVTPEQGMKLMGRQIEAGQALLAEPPVQSANLQNWEDTTREFLIKAFGYPNRNIEDFLQTGRIFSSQMNAGEAWWNQKRAQILQEKLVCLESKISLLEADLLLAPVQTHVADNPQVIEDRKKVFIVHGHDQGRRESVARYIEQLGLTPIILHEMPNEGRTLIEKFTEYAATSFAIVLLTADDRGGTKATSFENQKSRARQNVLLELGYFLGRLGRKNVCPLYESDVELPSDYDGVLFIPLDENGGWKLLLARELKQAGFDIDLNRVLQR